LQDANLKSNTLESEYRIIPIFSGQRPDAFL